MIQDAVTRKYRSTASGVPAKHSHSLKQELQVGHVYFTSRISCLPSVAAMCAWLWHVATMSFSLYKHFQAHIARWVTVPLCFCLFVDSHHHYATHSRNVDSPNEWRRRRICEGPGVLIVFRLVYYKYHTADAGRRTIFMGPWLWKDFQNARNFQN